MDHATPTALESAPPRAPNLPSHEVRGTPPRSPRRRWIWWCILVVLAAVGYWQWPKLKGFLPTGDATPQATAKGGRGRGRGAGGGTTQVVAARAQNGSIRVYFTGLGAVT